MANKKLKGIIWPNLPNDTYLLDSGEVNYNPEETYREGSTGKALQNKAEIDGYYTDMTVGDAEQLVSTVSTEDKAPYNFRTSGGSIDIGDREYVDAVVGGTVAWNQLIQNGNFANGATGWSAQSGDSSLSVSGGVATVTVNNAPVSAYNPAIRLPSLSYVAGHKHFVSFEMLSPASGNAYFRDEGYGTSGVLTTPLFEVVANTWSVCETIANTNNYSGVGYIGMNGSASLLSVGDSLKFKNIQIIDLTQMFGSTIADYIYSLEQANAGAGVALFKKLFPKPYYAYNEGELMSVNAVSHDMVGFNAWDEEWELGGLTAGGGVPTDNDNAIRSETFCKCVPSQQYCYTKPSATFGGIYWYDENKAFIQADSFRSLATSVFTSPSNAHYFKVQVGDAQKAYTTYNHDICINLHWDGERDGEYEAYVKRSYALDDVILRGIPKLDANNNIYYDGDTYESDGTVTRKYGYVDLGMLTWGEYGSTDTVTQYYTTNLDALAKPFSEAISDVGYYSQPIVANTIYISQPSGMAYVRTEKDKYASPAAFKTAMSGHYLIYKLATPTTETADSYNGVQWVDDFGTEEYVDGLYESGDRDVSVPVGHITRYVPNLRAKIETAPDSPDSDGDYLMRHSNGENSYVSLASSATIQNILDRLTALEGENNG